MEESAMKADIAAWAAAILFGAALLAVLAIPPLPLAAADWLFAGGMASLAAGVAAQGRAR